MAPGDQAKCSCPVLVRDGQGSDLFCTALSRVCSVNPRVSRAGIEGRCAEQVGQSSSIGKALEVLSFSLLVLVQFTNPLMVSVSYVSLCLCMGYVFASVLSLNSTL